MWIMNPKISRPAQDLLLSVAVNCSTHSQADVEVIGNFIKLRLKNKPNVNLYLVKSLTHHPSSNPIITLDDSLQEIFLKIFGLQSGPNKSLILNDTLFQDNNNFIPELRTSSSKGG